MTISPRWGYKGAQGGLVPDMSEKLKRQLVSLLGDHENTLRLISALHTHLHIYIIHRDDESTHPEGQPTPSERREAAKIILRDSQKLFNKISNEAGGIKSDLDYHLYKKMKHITSHFFLKDMEDALEGLMRGCQSFLENTYPQMKTTGITPKKVFAYRVATLFREILNEEPKKYIPEELEMTELRDSRKGLYARVLAACFIDSDGYIPGNLKEIVIWGISCTPEN